MNIMKEFLVTYTASCTLTTLLGLWNRWNLGAEYYGFCTLTYLF